MSICFIRLAQLKRQLGYRSPSGIYAAINRGLLTRPVKIGVRASGWPQHEVDAVVNARIAGESAEGIRKLVCSLHADRISLHQGKGA
jgi:prophage regulatory protein